MMTVVNFVAAIAAMIVFQRICVCLAPKSSERAWLDAFYDQVWALCDFMGWAVTLPEPQDVDGLDRYPEDGSNPFKQFITKIVVPDEYSRNQVAKALRYLHDQMSIDTDYMAVNYLVHMYADEDGEETGVTPQIVVSDGWMEMEPVELPSDSISDGLRAYAKMDGQPTWLTRTCARAAQRIDRLRDHSEKMARSLDYISLTEGLPAHARNAYNAFRKDFPEG